MNAQFLRLAKVVIGATMVAICTGATPASADLQRAAADNPLVAVRAVVTQLLPMTSAANSVVLQPLGGVRAPLRVILGSATRYVDNGIAVTSSAVKVGVVLKFEVTGSPAVATMVYILSHDPVFIDGTVFSVAPATGVASSLVVQPRDLKTPKIRTNLAGATLYYAGGVASTASTLSVGDQVQLVATGTPATATLVDFEGPKPISVMGTVSVLSASALTVLPQNPRAVAITIAVGVATTFKEGTEAVDASHLVLGSHVQVLASGSPETALLVDISPSPPAHFNGVITGLSPAIGSVKSLILQPDGFFTTTREFIVSRSSVYWSGEERKPLSALQVGDHVSVTASGDPLSATTIVSLDDGNKELVGSVLALKGTALTLQPVAPGALPVNLTLTNSTSYYSGRLSSTETALHVGDIVRVTMSVSSSTVAMDVEVLRAQFVGDVTKVIGETTFLRNLVGDLVTVHVTP